MANKHVRVICRLDIKGPNLIKGIQFDGHRVLGVPEDFALSYYTEGADELIFQDTVASLYQRNSCLEVIRRTASQVFIPLTVVGGLRSVEDIREVLRAGADKVAINTAAVENISLLKEAVKVFGSQCIVSSVEAYRVASGRYEIWTDYGRQRTNIDAYDWARRVVDAGVGEVLFTSIDREGMGRGYDIELTHKLATTLPVPVVACGGASSKEDFVKVVKEGKADAVAAASVFHYKYFKIPEDISQKKLQEKYRLRMGTHNDTGNLDFIYFGYGGTQQVPVTPVTIPEVKAFMGEHGILTRKSGAVAKGGKA